MQGVGEVVLQAPALPECGLLLVHPGWRCRRRRCSARGAAGSAPQAALPAGWADAGSMARDLAGLGNDLEAPAVALRPVIAEVLAMLRAFAGCLLARMSGSGATCFGCSPRAAAPRRRRRRCRARGGAAVGALRSGRASVNPGTAGV
jgi:4-diphosphocytidyl-2-C-methyl-D-erythritol kinase